jgi:hypothetical protein
VAYLGDSRQFPTLTDALVVVVILLAILGPLWLPTINPTQQNSNPLTAPNATPPIPPFVTIEIVFDAPPTQNVTVNNYHALYQFRDDEGYHMVFVVPANKTYVLNPVCCTKSRYLTPKKYYAFWLGGCVAIRTDK